MTLNRGYTQSDEFCNAFSEKAISSGAKADKLTRRSGGEHEEKRIKEMHLCILLTLNLK